MKKKIYKHIYKACLMVVVAHPGPISPSTPCTPCSQHFQPMEKAPNQVLIKRCHVLWREHRYFSPIRSSGVRVVFFIAISEEKKSVCKTQVWVLNTLLIRISEICCRFISLYSLLLFLTHLGVGMDSPPRGTCQGGDNNSLNPKKGMAVL